MPTPMVGQREEQQQPDEDHQRLTAGNPRRYADAGTRTLGRRQLPALERRRHVGLGVERHDLERVGPREQRAGQRC